MIYSSVSSSGRSSGTVREIRPHPPPPSPIRPIFLMNRALHFATKLNSRDIQKFNCFWVPSDDLFASARKAVFPDPTPTGVHTLKNTCSSQSVRGNLPQKSSTVLYEPKFGPPTSKIPGSASEFSDVVGYDPESIGALRNTTLGYLKRRLSGSIIVGG